MSNQVKVVKAKIKVLEKCKLSGLEYTQGKEIPVMFNPATYEVSRSNSFTESFIVASRKTEGTFQGEKAEKLTLTLFFDSETNVKDEITTGDILDRLREVSILAMADTENKLNRPPQISFLWGTFTFDGIMTSAKESYQYFDSKGNPIRATLAIEITYYNMGQLSPGIAKAPQYETDSDSDSDSSNPRPGAATDGGSDVTALGSP